MAPWDPGAYWVVRLLLHRGLAAIYLLAFLVAATQFRPLCGEDGLLPLDGYRDRWQFRDRPSLFHLVPDDRVIGITAWIGVGLSALALVGAPGWLPPHLTVPASMGLWAALWALYLSFVNAGQTFYGFGWESMLLEAGFLAVFLGAGPFAAPAVIVWLFRWLLFRNVFGAGLIKLRGDRCWRDLTCMDYHYETQPMPNPASWFAHHLPAAAHRVAVSVNHVVELAIPFLYFAPQPFASIAGVVTIGFQAWLVVTGNFSWLNALTIVLAFSTFSDPVLSPVIDGPAVAPVPLPLGAAAVAVTLVVLALSVRPARNLLSSGQAMNTSFDPLHLVNTYGAFGSITRDRYEIVLQGTDADRLDGDVEWETYTVPGKPTDLDRRPPQVAPYHHRLGWQLWFAAMSPSPRRHPWFHRLLAKLLEGDDGTRLLLGRDPFRDDPPTFVRALRYRYRFTTPTERRDTGRWWEREYVGTYVRPVSLDDRVIRRVRG